MKLSYSVSNLRRLVSTPLVELRPVTLLLGRNSVGKSTFLRSFPLLRQSVDTKASAPVLWYGDYVDFGDFHGAVNNNDDDKSIKFDFTFQDFVSSVRNTDYYSGIVVRPEIKELNLERVSLSYNIRSVGGSTVRDQISIEIPQLKARIDIDFSEGRNFVRSIKVNSEEVKNLLGEVDIYFPNGNLFVVPNVFRRGKDNRLLPESRRSIFSRAVQRELDPYVDRRISRNTVMSEAVRIIQKDYLSPPALLALSNAETKRFRDLYRYLRQGSDGTLLKRLNSILLIQLALQVLEAVNQNLSGYFQAVEYIGPARARSERFYRQQELEVSEISPDGRNLPMFLGSLSRNRLENFSAWVERTFGYGVSVRKTEGHISINLEHGGKSINVVDTGYGVSQVLPVLAQIWWMQQNSRDKRFSHLSSYNRKLLAIEQPELHLHPAHQALLADVFVEALSDRTQSQSAVNLSFLIETHSESMVNRLGELVANGQISPEDVQIVIFGNAGEEEARNDIQLATYDSDGVLQNWPYGFFNY